MVVPDGTVPSVAEVEDVDVLVVGAGISGIALPAPAPGLSTPSPITMRSRRFPPLHTGTDAASPLCSSLVPAAPDATPAPDASLAPGQDAAPQVG